MEEQSLADVLALQDSAEAYMYIIEFKPPDAHFETLGLKQGRSTAVDAALSDATRTSWKNGLAETLTVQLNNWLREVEENAGLSEVKAAMLEGHELSEMAEFPRINELEGVVFPTAINMKKRAYLVEVTVMEEAQLASIDSFVSLALKT